MADVRLIDANALAKWLDKEHYVDRPAGKCDERQNRVLGIAISALKNPQIAPTIDAVPVEYGQWVKPQGMMPPEYHHRKCCSVCGGWALYDRIGREWTSKYCPHCGAKMDGGAENG